jgi:hypothetical protein
VFADELLRPWYDALAGHLPPGGVFDCHTHLGEHDPSGFAATTEELDEGLSAIGARAAVFPLKEPEGYGDANLRVAQIAARSSGRLVSLARLDPEDAPLHRAQEALDAGAVGFKLHPDGDELDLTDPRLDDVYALAAERRRPIVVHAGPEVSGVGRRTLSLLDRHDGLRIILAHCALGDLAWLWREVEDHPGLFFDTAWWGPVHVLALFSLVPPGRILLGSDVPFSSPQSGVLTTVRCALQAVRAPRARRGGGRRGAAPGRRRDRGAGARTRPRLAPGERRVDAPGGGRRLHVGGRASRLRRRPRRRGRARPGVGAAPARALRPAR